MKLMGFYVEGTNLDHAINIAKKEVLPVNHSSKVKVLSLIPKAILFKNRLKRLTFCQCQSLRRDLSGANKLIESEIL